MGRFEGSRDRRGGGSSRGGSSRRDSGDRVNFEDRPRGRGRDSGRSFGRDRDERRPVEMTKVTCSACGVKCEVPFKPTSDKPVYCSDCFEKNGNGSRPSRGSDRGSSVDLTEINKKLDKIMAALDVE